MNFSEFRSGRLADTAGLALNGGWSWWRREARADSASVIAIWPD